MSCELRTSALLILLLGVSAAAQSGARPPAVEVARDLQAKYDGIRDFSADFVHTYRGGALRRTATERGSVLVKKPGKMRWTYKAPEEKVFVSDGRKVYSYIPADKQVIVSAVPPDDQAGTPVLFLAGKGNLTRDFTASFAELSDAPKNTHALRLVPKQPERDYEWIVLVVDRDTMQIQRLTTGDRQGGESTFAFSNLKENLGLPDTSFTFKIPRGVDVIDNGDVRGH